MVVIPATSTCPDDSGPEVWIEEYNGILMTTGNDYVCVDNPLAGRNSFSNLKPIISKCFGDNCVNSYNYFELKCVVCSKELIHDVP